MANLRPILPRGTSTLSFGATAARPTPPTSSSTCTSASTSAYAAFSPRPRAAATAQVMQVRHATFIPRPQRPYAFTQLVQLSDGSTYTVRTTSPAALYRSAKDSRNHVLWQPSEKSLRHVEVDEAGKLAAFRERFGRGWDAASAADNDDDPRAGGGDGSRDAARAGEGEVEGRRERGREGGEVGGGGAGVEEDAGDALADLISGYAAKDGATARGLSAKEQKQIEKRKKK